MPGDIRVGISGWTYPPWRGVFFPRGLPQHRELEYASQQLNSIEINGSFYGLQRPSSYERWHASVPKDFVFSLKANRFITHIRRLHEIERPLANFMASGPLLLKEKLGPILWQFPPNFRFDPESFERFLKLLPRNYRDAASLARHHESWMNGRAYAPARVSAKENLRLRHAVEIRNASFRAPEFVALLRRHQIALVFADSAGRWPYAEDLCADFIYLRLHGKGQMYVGGYDDSSLHWWESRIHSWMQGKQPRDAVTIVDTYPRTRRDAYIYFDNDVKVEAPFNAMRLYGFLTGAAVAPPARTASSG